MTSIEWTHRPGTKGVSWNPLRAYRAGPDGNERRGWHCEHVSPGCVNCYSERQNKAGARGGTGLPYKPGHRDDVRHELHEPTLLQPLSWRAPRTVFVCSMTDLFGDWVMDEWIDRVFAVMALAPQHTFIVLTKRSARMRYYVTSISGHAEAADRLCNAAHAIGFEDEIACAVANWITGFSRWSHAVGDGNPLDGSRPRWPLPNVWLGVSVEDQQRADERIPDLLETPAAVRFVSAEPLLGPIDFTDLGGPGSAKGYGAHGFSAIWKNNGIGRAWLDWIIVGGESGPGARPMHPDWVRSIRDQCYVADVPFFFKQWGAWVPANYSESRCSAILVPADGANHGLYPGHPPHASNLVHDWTDGIISVCVGKSRAGRLLDGVEHSGWPEAR